MGDPSKIRGRGGAEAGNVTLEEAGGRDGVLLSNLMELYVHDLSAMFEHVKIGADGRFGYPQLSSYLSGDGERRAFVIRRDEGVAGFVLARRGSPASDDPRAQDIAEFFVLRQLRGRGVGRAAATLLWDRMPGSWTVRASAANPDAIRFWREVVAKYTRANATESERSLGGRAWVVFGFDNSR